MENQTKKKGALVAIITMMLSPTWPLHLEPFGKNIMIGQA